MSFTRKIGASLKKTFLTDAQRRVLELRAKGLSQAEIARMFKTTRANISILERRARENIEKAERTVELAKRLRTPVILRVKAGEDLLGVPKRLLKAADVVGIKVSMSYPDLISEIRLRAATKIHGRSVKQDFEIALTSAGELIIS